LNQLLTEMDGFPSQCSDVTIIVIAATNRSDVLDPAILRRFDRQIHVPYPDGHGRRDILKIHARKVQCNLNQINWELLASHEMTGQFSGSDLRNLVNDAALLAVRDRSGSVKQSHLLHAIRRARAMKVNTSIGSTNLWSLTSNS
jgi:cell division protease FtsH